MGAETRYGYLALSTGGNSLSWSRGGVRIPADDRPSAVFARLFLEGTADEVRGQVQKLNWMRAPNHAPEVVAEIERTVRAAAPFPAPARMGKVVYTDTWLWHKSGRFQLDTLTEGQD